MNDNTLDTLKADKPLDSLTPTSLTCFKAYDIRGKLGEELNEDIAYAIGRAFALEIKPKTVVVGGDIRLTSEILKLALAKGLQDQGVDVIDLGMTGTEEIYFATRHLGVDGGIEVTASHNPLDYNGMKFVREDSKPISGDSGLRAIQQTAEKVVSGEMKGPSADIRGKYITRNLKAEYAQHMLEFIDPKKLKPLKLVVNSGNGAAGPALDAIENALNSAGASIEFIKVHHKPDGKFPNGIPNPLLPECREDTAKAVIEHGADMGIAWDGDFDRCFLFDEEGEFIEGYYIVGLLAEAFLQQESRNQGVKEKIIHDPRLTWNTIDLVETAGGEAIQSKTGHAFIKERMRSENAIYGGEMSAHHYFRDFGYCDSGMIPWLLVAELLSVKGVALSSLISERIAAYPSSGEINSKLESPKQAIQRVRAEYEPDAVLVDETDGISMAFKVGETEWRFNLRSSNTEPVVRLNVESKGDVTLMQNKKQQILELLRA
ncbi:phosphomannomutase CpsG [Thalassotalea sp. PS06]|uniref:phosphomannomutase CpsG n=1 Tax=Thalassotalea sp. PS06 TaxID=2594005 RepID=UPI001165AB84|nr:phosphomannomutase CpsG [Thalassotalea sp. PS06]QDP01977.1 phosphomannomutase CpsG [Thalassotalea sp. PS06]